MKKLILASTLMVLSGAAFANDDSGVYVGYKYGNFFVDVEGTNTTSDRGVLLGYRFSNGVAVEFENTSTEIDVFSKGLGIGSLDVDTNALYLVYRTPGEAYFKLKGGILEEDISADCRACDAINESETGFSAGVGVGMNAGKYAQFELELTVLEEDVNFLSLGVNFLF